MGVHFQLVIFSSWVSIFSFFSYPFSAIFSFFSSLVQIRTFSLLFVEVFAVVGSLCGRCLFFLPDVVRGAVFGCRGALI